MSALQVRRVTAAVALSSFATACASIQRPVPTPLTPEDRVVIDAAQTPIRVLSTDSAGVARSPGCVAKQVRGVLRSVVGDTVFLSQVTNIRPSTRNDPACVAGGGARVELGPNLLTRPTIARAGTGSLAPVVVMGVMAVALIVVISLQNAERRAVEILVGFP